jgi:Ulp1 family protease
MNKFNDARVVATLLHGNLAYTSYAEKRAMRADSEQDAHILTAGHASAVPYREQEKKLSEESTVKVSSTSGFVKDQLVFYKEELDFFVIAAVVRDDSLTDASYDIRRPLEIEVFAQTGRNDLAALSEAKGYPEVNYPCNSKCGREQLSAIKDIGWLDDEILNCFTTLCTAKNFATTHVVGLSTFFFSPAALVH